MNRSRLARAAAAIILLPCCAGPHKGSPSETGSGGSSPSDDSSVDNTSGTSGLPPHSSSGAHGNPTSVVPSGQHREWGWVNRGDSASLSTTPDRVGFNPGVVVGAEAVLVRTEDIATTNAVIVGTSFLGLGNLASVADPHDSRADNADISNQPTRPNVYFNIVSSSERTPSHDGGQGTAGSLRRYTADRVWNLPAPQPTTKGTGRSLAFAIIQLTNGVREVAPATIGKRAPAVGASCDVLFGWEATRSFQTLDTIRYRIPAVIVGLNAETVGHRDENNAPDNPNVSAPLYCGGYLVGTTDHWYDSDPTVVESARFDVLYDTIHAILQQIQNQTAGSPLEDGETVTVPSWWYDGQ